MSAENEVLFPVGRLVAGSMSIGRKEDYYGKPLTNKDGTPAAEYSFGVAFRKEPGQAWWDTSWGKKMLAIAHAAFPQGQPSNPSFAWKVHDGDSQVPNKKGRKPCDNEGWPGHWVVFFSSRFAPKTLRADGAGAVDPTTVKAGHYVEVLAEVKGNGSSESPGLFVNHVFVAHSGYGPEIDLGGGPDPASVGFGKGPLPPGANAVPESRLAPPAPVPGTHAAPQPAAPSPAAVQPPAPPAPPVPTAPHPGILAPKVMLPAAGGATYEQFIAAGWTDAQLIAKGMMQA